MLDKMTICKQSQSWARQPWSLFVNLYITKLQVLFGGHRKIEVQCWASQPVSPLVNLYIVELWVLFVGQGTIEVEFWAHQPEKPRSKKCPSMERGIHICSIKCRPYFLKVHVYYVFIVCRKTFISVTRPDCTNFLV